ncbi:MAG: methyltransferase domain-containing protein [Acidobacteria bacterium]|nr:methyltransferase domain-containing protein [Acidobacteriota bacterium]
MLACPVRGCQRPLARDGRQLRCASGHCFDVARSGYVNLLQPQDKKSKQPGDSAEAVAARRRLHDLGVTRPLLDGVADVLKPCSSNTVLDAGCGEGFYLGSIVAEHGCQGCGVDLSIAAIEAAARRYKNCEWIVANADRALPYADQSFDAVMSITARMNTVEFARVLKPGGRLLVAVAAPEDLIEVRGRGKERVERTVDEFRSSFELVESRRVTHRAEMDRAAVEDLRLAIYRPMQSEEAAAGLVTFSLDLLLFRPRRSMMEA